MLASRHFCDQGIALLCASSRVRQSFHCSLTPSCISTPSTTALFSTVSDRLSSVDSDTPLIAFAGGKQHLRRCLVTGGTSGIGLVTARLLLSKGHSVTIMHRESARAEKAVAILKAMAKAKTQQVDFMTGDLTDTASFLKEWSDRSTKDKPAFDTLINCAGATMNRPLLTASPALIGSILHSNLQAPIELAKQLLKDYFKLGKHLTSSRIQLDIPSFCVINVSSVLADLGRSSETAYSASKSGLGGFTKSLIAESAEIRERYPALPNFRANIVSPGFIDTPMTQGLPEERKQAVLDRIPVRRFGMPEEVAHGILFLIENEYANGTTLQLDGGLAAV